MTQSPSMPIYTGKIHEFPEVEDSSITPLDILRGITSTLSPSETVIKFFRTVPIDMKYTNTGTPRWEKIAGDQAGDIYPLDKKIYTCSSAMDKNGNLGFFIMNNNQNYQLGNDKQELKVFPIQFVQQDGGSIILPETSVILTPSITGCSFFKLSVCGIDMAFHVNVISENANFSKFSGLSLNILKELSDSLPELSELKQSCREITTMQLGILNTKFQIELLISRYSSCVSFKRLNPSDDSIDESIDYWKEKLDEQNNILLGKYRANAECVRIFLENFVSVANSNNISLIDDIDTILLEYKNKNEIPPINAALDFENMNIMDKISLIFSVEKARESLSGYYATLVDNMDDFQNDSPEIVAALVKDEKDQWFMLEQKLLLPMGTRDAHIKVTQVRITPVETPDFVSQLHLMAQQIQNQHLHSIDEQGGPPDRDCVGFESMLRV